MVRFVKKIPYLPLVCFIARCQCNQFQDFLQILNKPHGHYHHGKSCFCSFRFKAKNLNFIKFWKGGGWKKNFFKPLFGVLAKIDVLSILSFPTELYPQGNGHISQKFSDLKNAPESLLVCFIAHHQCNQFQDFLQILNKPHGHYHHGKSCFCSFRFKAKNLNFIKFWKGGGWKKNFFKPLFGVLAKIDVLSILSFPTELYPQGNGHISQKFSDLKNAPESLLVCFIAHHQCNQFQDFLQILNKPFVY